MENYDEILDFAARNIDKKWLSYTKEIALAEKEKNKLEKENKENYKKTIKELNEKINAYQERVNSNYTDNQKTALGKERMALAVDIFTTMSELKTIFPSFERGTVNKEAFDKDINEKDLDDMNK